VLIVSIISIIGIFALSINANKLKKILIYFISFSAGALFGDAFIHLIPELTEEGMLLSSSVYILLGILIFFILEKFIHWRHCHLPQCKDHVHPFAYMNLIGDSLHNFIDGLVIAASYMLSPSVGIATSIAIVLHEIPQEIGDFGVLIYAGFSKLKAIIMNFFTALTAILGAIVALSLNKYVQGIEFFLISLAIGGFIYIAGSDLIPELHKETRFSRSFFQIIAFVLGIGVMLLLLLLE
jgi:zinc and cadmium transporter